MNSTAKELDSRVIKAVIIVDSEIDNRDLNYQYQYFYNTYILY